MKSYTAYNLDALQPSADKSKFFLTSIRLIENDHGYDRVSVQNRGAVAGTLIFTLGDGREFAEGILHEHRRYDWTPLTEDKVDAPR